MGGTIFLTKTFIKHQNSCPNTGLVISQAIIKGDKNFFPLLSEVKGKEILEVALNAYFHPFPIGFFYCNQYLERLIPNCFFLSLPTLTKPNISETF